MSLSQYKEFDDQLRIFAQEQELGYISPDEDLWPKGAFYCLKCPQDAKRKTIGLCQFVKIKKGTNEVTCGRVREEARKKKEADERANIVVCRV